MTCGSCGETNRDGAHFCATCGAGLASTCSSCEAELSPAARFCDQCGTAVGDDPANSTTDDAAVRKTVTIMFADLVGSTAFGERVDAEAARHEMAEYHRLAKSVIDRHQGTVVKFIGDGVMAVFGVPDVAEDDADRAVRAGIELQREFEPLATRILEIYDATVDLRVGVNTGEIAIADTDDDMIGDAINTAARIEAACIPGQVLVGEQTWRLTRTGISYEVLGDVEVKGKAQPVATFQVVAESHGEAVETPFVGRDHELAQLTVALETCLHDNTTQLVAVVGSPGVGKTRLAAELRRGSADRVQSFELRVDRDGTATFEPMADLLREVTSIDDGLADSEVVEQLAAWIGDDGDQARLAPLLASFLGAAPPRSTEESFWASRRLVEILAARRPLVVVVDDLQWSQPLFLSLLDHLVEWVEGPALLIGLARPELREIRPSLAEPGRWVADVVTLEGLDPRSTEALAAQLLGATELPGGLAERLPESTEGNPLFVRELVRMLVDDGVLVGVGGAWELAIDSEAVEVPPTIQSLLASRVERMPDDERRIVEMASVIGTEFARGALNRLLPDTRDTELDHVLERLRRKELVDPTGNYWGDEPLFRFHHVLIRDAAYRRLLKQHRAELHLQVARWTEETAARFSGDHEIAIAHHYEQAHLYLGQLGPLDDAGVAHGTKAAGLLHVAAERSLNQDDLAAAGSLATRALALLSKDDTSRKELLLIACEAFVSSGNVPATDPPLDELTDLAIDDGRLGAWVDAFRAHRVWLTEPDRLSTAEPSVAAAADRLEALDDQAGVAKARLVRAMLLARLGRVGDCEAELDLALTAARAADDRRRITSVLGAAPLAALWGPSPVARAGGRCLDIIRLLRITSASPMVEATSIRCQAVLEAMRGRFDQARDLIGRARATVEELGQRHGMLETEMFSGVIELLADDPLAAEPHLRNAYAGLGTLGVGADAGQAAALLSRTLLLQGRVDEAEQLATDSESLAGQNLQTAIASRAARAEIAAARRRFTEAVALAEEAVAIAATTDLTVDHANAVASLASVTAQAGEAVAAAGARARATALYEAKGATATLATEAPPAPPSMDGLDVVTNLATTHARIEVFEVDDSMTLVERSLAGLIEALAAGRVDEVPDWFADEFTSTDSRSMGNPTGSAEEIVGSLTARSDWDTSFTSRTLAVRGEQLGLFEWTMTAPNGFETMSLVVNQVDEEGRALYNAYYPGDQLERALDELDRLATRMESFDPDDLDVAIARYDDLVSDEPPTAPEWLTEPWVSSMSSAVKSRYREGLTASFAPDFEWIGYRSLMSGLTADRDQFVTMAEAIGEDFDLETFEFEVLAEREARLALTRVEVGNDDGLELSFIMVIETNSDGTATRGASFDLEQLEDAFDVLDQWYGESIDAGRRSVIDLLRRSRAAEDSGDIKTLGETYSSDLTVVDNRVVGLGSLDFEGWVECLSATSPVMGERRTCLPRFHRLTDQGIVAEFRGTNPTGFEWRFITISIVDEGQISHAELFELDDLDAALVRFDELTAD